MLELPIWCQLKEEQELIASYSIKELFLDDPERFHIFSLEGASLFLDYSKNRLTYKAFDALCQLANDRQVPEKIEALFAGKLMNVTEDRKVGHTRLRQFNDLNDENEEIRKARFQMTQAVNLIRNHSWLGFTGKPIVDIVNVGVGGSDLGIRLALDALKEYQQKDLHYHLVSNIDAAQLSELLLNLSPETTLFILSSKSFNTEETLCNGNTIKKWLLSSSGGVPSVLERHMVAVTAHREKAAAFGIPVGNIFPLWDWVGGRFSLWSSIGLLVAISIGMESFNDLLQGAYAMDQHFQNQPLHQNMPVILALLSIWYINFWDIHIQGVIPYAQRLRYFPAYLQQLEMESNGKSVSQQGKPLNYKTASVILGGVGTDAQHSFFQYLHQGTQWIPIDFIGIINPHHTFENHHRLLLANCFAQSQTLMLGNAQSKSPFRVMEGNRPSNTILMPELNPFTLGALIALYEHKTLVEGFIWGINSFDQWGVEMGKEVVQVLLKTMQQEEPSIQDASTKGLLEWVAKKSKVPMGE